MPTSQPVTPVQLLRSQVLNKRPNPAQMLLGQAAVNINSEQPGLFFADETNATLIKIGPCAVGDTAPNTGASGAPGQLGNTLGELWLDITPSTLDKPGPVLKVWDGSQWIDCMPYRYANTIVSDTPPTIGLHPNGTLWWDSSTGLMYVLYEDANANRQWTQVSGTPVQ
jgi:hypothetical protein